MEATPQRWLSHPHTIVKFPTLALDIPEAEKILEPKATADGQGPTPKDHDDPLPGTGVIPIVAQVQEFVMGASCYVSQLAKLYDFSVILRLVSIYLYALVMISSQWATLSVGPTQF